MKRVALFLCLTGIIPALAYGQDRDQRIADLGRQLTEAKGSVAALQKTIELLSTEVQALRRPDAEAAVASGAAAPPAPAPSKEAGGAQTDATHDFAERIIGPEIGSDERDSVLEAKPEIFIQTRYSVAPFDGSGTAFQPNIRLSRIETRWAGKINDRVGAGIEIQFQESVEGSPEKLVNDAFLEYYVTDHATVRAGQFIKPFGFGVQQSSWIRESPERAMFSGYFFPGERDRGIMLSGDLGFLPAAGFKDLQYFVGAFNGNRFFNDSNRQVNYMARIRKIFNKRSWPSELRSSSANSSCLPESRVTTTNGYSDSISNSPPDVSACAVKPWPETGPPRFLPFSRSSFLPSGQELIPRPQNC
jgi:hypothetical protein